MMPNRSAHRAVVRCGQCPGHPVLPAHDEDTDTRRCVRCQGEHRWLPLPHPDNHLCMVCRRECPGCQALTGATDGRKCRACQGICRTCSTPLPRRGDPKDALVHIEPASRKDRRRRYTKTIFPRSWGWDLCTACRGAQTSAEPVRAVLAALPDKVVRACGGNVPPSVIDALHTELQRGETTDHLTARIERRWWNGWASRPLHREGDRYSDGYRPDDVALWLVVPTSCSGRCEDGWHRAGHDQPDQDDTPCGTCRGGRLLTHTHTTVASESEADEAAVPGAPVAARSLGDAVTYRPPMRECTGRDGACGVPVADPYTQCPSCLDWPLCACSRRYDPDQAAACRMCTSGVPA